MYSSTDRSHGFVLSGAGSYVAGFQFLGTDRKQTGLNLSNTTNAHIERAFGRDLYCLLDVAGATNLSVEHCRAIHCQYGYATADVEGLDMVGCKADQCIEDGFYLTDSHDFQINGCSAVTCLGNGLYLHACTRGTILANAHQNGKSGIKLGSCNAVSAVGSRAVANCYGANNANRLAGMLMDGCSSCKITACTLNNDELAVSHQTYGLEINGGKENMVACNSLCPNNGPDSPVIADKYHPDNCFRNTGSGTVEFGNFNIVLE
jgi:hypothetical protein